mgnify:CR=1 FL=1
MVEKYHKVQESWKKVLKLSKTQVIFDLRDSVEKVYELVPAKKTLTPYHIFAMDSHLDSYKYVVNKFKEKNPVNDTGETPLHVAAFSGDLEMCKYITDSIDNKSPKSNDGVTPLHFAARTGHLNVCKYIIEEVGEKVERDIRKQFPLHWAAYGGNLDVFIYLFGMAEDKNPMGNFGITPLDLAVMNGHLSICKYTMEHAKDVRTALWKILEKMLKFKNAIMVRLLSILLHGKAILMYATTFWRMYKTKTLATMLVRRPLIWLIKRNISRFLN